MVTAKETKSIALSREIKEPFSGLRRKLIVLHEQIFTANIRKTGKDYFFPVFASCFAFLALFFFSSDGMLIHHGYGM
jgi:hypothetical protein